MAKVTLAVFPSSRNEFSSGNVVQKHIIQTDSNQPNLMVVSGLDDERDNQLFRIVAVESGKQKRETMFFLSIKETSSGRAELVIIAKDSDGKQTEKSVVGKWWDREVAKNELTAE